VWRTIGEIMALTYKIKAFETDGSDKLVGFRVDNNGSILIIDKRVAIVEGKTDNQYCQEALALAQPEIDAWVISEANIGKIWNPDTNTLE
jgi:hypothetical protein